MFSQSNLAGKRKPVIKSEGITPTEKFLNHLCENTFLSLWSYPNIYRNQKKKGTGIGKELCDMLVIFDEHVLIFSDKNCTFPTTGNIKQDWQRWYRRAIYKSATQVWGAERWLKDFPDRIFLNRECTIPFPLDIPKKGLAKFHLIVVANGCEETCKAILRGSGSLMFNSTLSQEGNIDELTNTPFMVGDLNKNKTFIHILTKTSLDILLYTLDTISDFVWYLEKKEKLIRSMISVCVPGEEELLAFYLSRINSEGLHDFVVDNKFNGFGMEEGIREKFSNSPQRIKQLKQNEISYSWDRLIERFSHHALNATQYFTNHLKLSDTEIGLRFMAREPRLKRRLLMKGLIDFFTNTPDGTMNIKCVIPNTQDGAYYVFLCLPQPNYSSYEEYRIVRGNLLEACLMVVKYMYPKALDIVGIASDPIRPGLGSSEDLLYLDAREWSDEMNKEAAHLQIEFGILTSPRITPVNEKEYPDAKT